MSLGISSQSDTGVAKIRCLGGIGCEVPNMDQHGSYDKKLFCFFRITCKPSQLASNNDATSQNIVMWAGSVMKSP